jgi:hypothetical protein
MWSWVLSVAAGAVLAAITYARLGSSAPLPMLLRFVAGTLAAALLLNAPLAPARPMGPWVALDASASWALTGDSSTWLAATRTVDSVRRAGADSMLQFGSALHLGPIPAAPWDSASRVAPVVEVARALGRPMVIVTDGRLGDPERLEDLPRGSLVLVPLSAAGPDLAVARLEAPGGAVLGDTIEVRVLLRAGSAGAPARRARLTLGGRPIADRAVDSLGAYGEREVRFAVTVPTLEGDQPLVAALDGSDAVAANDRAEAVLRVAGTASVALVSTTPDQDARFALMVLRGTQRGAVRAYWRVAPGQWRESDALRAVPEDVVRRALEQASLVVLHGDTGYFGPPRSRVRGALVLMAPADGGDEYYASTAGDSPLSAALGDLPWEQLPPLRVGPAASGRTLSALVARRARRGEERTVVALREGPPRTVVVSAAGFWRWRTRGGRTGDAFDALWGSIFDWVAAGSADAGPTRPGTGVADELVPRPPVVASGAVGTGPVRDLAPRSRDAWWLAALALLALCGEWMLRRRIGWR